MTVQNPAIFLQEGSHPAEDVRRALGSIVGQAGGLVSGSDLVVSENSAGADMSIDVAGGAIWIAGTEDTYQGVYYCENRGVTNIPVQAADVVDPRIDLVVARVYDSSYSGTQDEWALDIVTGTPASSPVAPALPANSFSLATISVAANATTIVDADITDTRVLTDETITGNLVVGGGASVGGDLTVTGNLTAANQGLVFVKSVSIGSGVSSVTVTDAFDSRFDNYRVTIDTVLASAAGNWWEFQFTGYTSAGYYGYARGLNWLGGEDNAFRNNSPSLLIGRTGNIAGQNGISIDVFGPYKSSQRTAVSAVGSGYLSFVFGGGELATNSSETAFIIKPTAGTMTGGTIRVYGYNNGA